MEDRRIRVTDWIEARANEFLERGLQGVKRISFEKALSAPRRTGTTISMLILLISNVLDMDAISGAKISLGLIRSAGPGPLLEPIAERYGLNLTVVNKAVDPTSDL